LPDVSRTTIYQELAEIIETGFICGHNCRER
jgi:hypothetical protein